MKSVNSLSKVLLKRSAGIGSREQVEGFILLTVLRSTYSVIISKLVIILGGGF